MIAMDIYIERLCVYRTYLDTTGRHACTHGVGVECEYACT